ncbi:MAG: ribonuclease H-like YkuK family protein [Bacillota bacterium]
MTFVSPSKGSMTFDSMIQNILEFIHEDPEGDYRIIIGSDSHVRDETNFVSAVVIHRVGKGARYYYSRKQLQNVRSLRQRIFYETALSLELANKVVSAFEENGHSELNIEIHLDVGSKGETKGLIKEVVGMVTGCGFEAHIKPDSSGASKVADKHTK